MEKSPPPELEPPRPGGTILKIKELEHPEGGAPRTIAFTEFDIKPLGYEDLASAKLHQAMTIPLEIYNGRIVETDIKDVDVTKYVRISTTLESPFTARAIGLVRGGWLPSTLAATRDNAVILPDRNIISDIVGRFEAGRPVRREPDFLDLFENQNVRISPLVAALEGNRREIPTAEVARTQLNEAVTKLGRALPQATLMVGPSTNRGLLGLIDDMQPGFVRKQALLRRLAPGLCSPSPRQEIDARWRAVLNEADAHHVPRNSLLVLALLSTLVHPVGECAAKKLLKLHDRYDDGDAYNALSDLQALELLLHCIAFQPNIEPQLCTADRNLALFWVGIGASAIERAGSGIRCSLMPHPAILPAPYGERWAKDIRLA